MTSSQSPPSARAHAHTRHDESCSHNHAPLAPARAAALTKRLRLLVAATLAYNVVEGVVGIGAGIAASSTALLGFGIDSVIELSSSAIVSWQFSAHDPSTREGRGLRAIAVSFYALALYLVVESVRALIGGTTADASPVGIALAAASLVVMPVLASAKRRAGEELGSRSAVADSKQTQLCTYLSAVLLVGLTANATMGWSWLDPAASLIIAAVAAREGRAAWRGNHCCETAPNH